MCRAQRIKKSWWHPGCYQPLDNLTETLCIPRIMVTSGPHKGSPLHQGMLRSAVLGQFYKDLQDPLYKTPFAIYHRRYSTNTTPKWPLAQPMRVLGHNGARAPMPAPGRVK